MKKRYHIPTTEVITIGTKELMLPPEARMSNPGFEEANTFSFDDEEDEGLNLEKPKNDLWY